VLVGNDQVEMLAVAKRAIGLEAVDGGEVVGLDAEAVLVPFVDRDILECGRAELLERPARRPDARRDVFEPSLVGRAAFIF
jgi:hypothetical protein